MAAYTKNTPGAPLSGKYAVGDVVTDSLNVRWRCVQAGLPGVFVVQDGQGLAKQAAPAAKTTSTTLTAAELMGGLITGNQGASGAANYTLPLASALETALAAEYGDLAVGDSFDFHVINLSTTAAEDVTLLTAAGWTLVGSMVMVEQTAANPAGSNGHFRVRRTAANAYTLYRIA